MALILRLTRVDPSVPWGFRMKGGLDCGEPLFVSYVVPGGLADCHGLQTGARILKIGGDSVDSMTHQQAQQAIIRCCNDVELEIYDPKYRGYAQFAMSSVQPAQSVINGPPASHTTLNIDLQRPCPTSTCLHTSPPCSPKIPSESTNLTYKPLTYSAIKRELQMPCQSSPPTISLPPPPSFRHWQVPKPSNTALDKFRCNMNATEGQVSPTYVSPQANGYPDNAKQLKRGILRTDCAKQRPICYTCNQVIQGPYIDTMDHCFCPNHFKCSICCASLNDRSFAEHDGKYYCEVDFAKFVAPKCAKCGQSIIGQITKALNKDWHPHCFACYCCGKPLKDKFYVEEGDQVLCESDWQNLHQTQCGRCKMPISEIDRFVEAFGQQFHAHCFCCAACQVPLEGKPFHARDNKPFCRAHAHAVALYA